MIRTASRSAKNLRLSAYVLTGDPTWIEASVSAYYPLVERIIVSCDRTSTGWAGNRIPVEECIERLRAIDPDRKMQICEGDYCHPQLSPMENETRQRQVAMSQAGDGLDWIIALDNDEILPQPEALLRAMARASPSHAAIDWPMRVFFRATPEGRLLEIIDRRGRPGTLESVPIAHRPGTPLSVGRRTSAPVLRCTRRGIFERLGLRRADALLSDDELLLHLSWVRTEAAIRTKVASFGHARDFDGAAYVDAVWKNSVTHWKTLRDFHPISPASWHKLRAIEPDRRLLAPSAADCVTCGLG